MAGNTAAGLSAAGLPVNGRLEEAVTKHIIVGTAGHIDHGKTALVKALTGIDADRLEEEKRRGITIDIGFAHLDLGNDLRLGFVDVPGHEKFVKNMLAGVGGIDLVMLVIAADESIMPQTREHFDICRLLDIPKGLVAVTKTDMVDSEFVDLVTLEAEEYLTGSFLEGAPIVPISSKTGEGIEELQQQLGRLAREAEPKNSRHHFRLPIDRVFVMKGFGSVVTGTMVSGSLGIDSEVEILPDQRRVRVRGIEVHDRQAERAVAGQRTAINLAGVDASSLHRGMVLAAAGKFQPSLRIDCSLDLLPSARPLKYGARVHFHTGAAEIEGRVYFLDRRAVLKPGESAYTQVRFQDPLVVLRGDRFIVRQFSPVVTIGGGVVLDNLAPRHRNSEDWLSKLEALETGQPNEILEALIRGEPYGLSSAEIISRTAWLDEEYEHSVRALEQQGVAVKVHDSPTWLVHRDPFRAALNQVSVFLGLFHKENPLLPGAPKEALRSTEFASAPAFFIDALLARLVRDKKVAIDAEPVRLLTHRVVLQQDEQEARDKIVSAFEQAGLAVPALPELLSQLQIDAPRARRILQGLLREKLLVKVTADLVFHNDSIERLKSLLQDRKRESDRITVPVFKDLAEISRKYAIPLLEYLDREKVTRRVGDERLIL